MVVYLDALRQVVEERSTIQVKIQLQHKIPSITASVSVSKRKIYVPERLDSSTLKFDLLADDVIISLSNGT